MTSIIVLRSQTTWDIYDTSNDGYGGQLLAEYRYDSDFTPTGTTLEYADGTSYSEKTTYVYDNDTGSAFTAPSGISVPTSQQLGLGNLIEVDDYDANGLSSPSTYTHYTYDPITGNQATVATPDGTISYVYNDATGQLQETSTGSNDEFYSYNALGQLQDVYTLELNGTRYATFAGFDSSGLPTFREM